MRQYFVIFMMCVMSLCISPTVNAKSAVDKAYTKNQKLTKKTNKQTEKFIKKGSTSKNLKKSISENVNMHTGFSEIQKNEDYVEQYTACGCIKKIARDLTTLATADAISLSKINRQRALTSIASNINCDCTRKFINLIDEIIRIINYDSKYKLKTATEKKEETEKKKPKKRKKDSDEDEEDDDEEENEPIVCKCISAVTQLITQLRDEKTIVLPQNKGVNTKFKKYDTQKMLEIFQKILGKKKCDCWNKNNEKPVTCCGCIKKIAPIIGVLFEIPYIKNSFDPQKMNEIKEKNGQSFTNQNALMEDVFAESNANQDDVQQEPSMDESFSQQTMPENTIEEDDESEYLDENE